MCGHDGEPSHAVSTNTVVVTEPPRGGETIEQELTAFLQTRPPKLQEIGEGTLFLNGNGQGLEELSKNPLAQANKPPAAGWCDTCHLSLFEGTNFVQWFGRRSDGRFYPYGKIMQIIQ